LSDVIFSFAVKLRLRIQVCLESPCRLTSSNGAICTEITDPFADHVFRCLKGGHSVKLHNRIRDILSEIGGEEGYLASKEENIGTHTNENAIMDIVMRNAEQNRRWYYVDVSICHPVVGEHRALVQRSNTGGASSQRREYEKTRKYQHLVQEPFIFFPFVMETTGRVGRLALLFLNDIFISERSKTYVTLARLQSEMYHWLWVKVIKAEATNHVSRNVNSSNNSIISAVVINDDDDVRMSG
jgi:hypothetical protein